MSDKNLREKSIIRREWFQLLLFALLVKSIIFIFALDNYGGDEFYYVSRGLLLSNGLVPYSDFQYSFPPGLIVVTAIPHFFGGGYVALRIITGIIDAVNAVLVYSIAKRYSNRNGGIAAFIFYSFNVISLQNSATTMAEPYIAFLILLAIKTIDGKTKPAGASLILGICTWTKPWTVLFWGPIVAGFALKGKIGKMFFSRLAFWHIILFLPLVLFSPQFINSNNEYYLKYHPPGSGNSILENTILVFNYMILYQPFILLALALLIINPDLRCLFNPSALWAFSGIFFIAFPQFYPIHHLQVTLGGACILAACIMAGYFSQFKNPKIILPVTAVIISIMAIVLNFQALTEFGSKSFPIERIDSIISQIKNNSDEGDLLLQDYGFYSYLSGVQDMRNTGWYYAIKLHDDVVYTHTKDEIVADIEESGVKWIIVTEEFTYPPRALKHFQTEFRSIDLGWSDYPIIYEVDSDKHGG